MHSLIVRKLKAKFIDPNPFFGVKTQKNEDETVGEDFGSISVADESLNFQQIMNFIHNEVSKVLKSKRITEQTLLELDSRVAIEVYLREKKAAILSDK